MCATRLILQRQDARRKMDVYATDLTSSVNGQMIGDEALYLFEYNDWANARLFSRCAELSADQWSQELGGSFPTLLSVVAHVVGGEWIWLQRWKGESPTSAPDWFTCPSASALRNALEDVEAERRQFLRSLTKEDFERDVQYTLLDGSRGTLPLSTLLRHAMNHSTYHRGQIAAMLRQMNVAPPPTDLLVYAMERRASGAPADA
jgi:uncharacterized damage-inducible protein DinB